MRARLARLLLVVLLAFACGGCARADEVVELRQWTLVTPDGTRQSITLPARFAPAGGGAGSNVVLETDVDAPAEWRGRPLSLALTLVLGDVVLTANGKQVESRDLGLAHSWRIDDPGAATGGHFSLRLSMDERTTPWLTTLPRLSPTPTGDDAYASISSFTFASSTTGTSLLAALALLYLILYVFDRTRPAHGWFALQAGAAAFLPAFQRWPSGWTQTSTGAAFIAALFVAQVAAIGFYLSYFRRTSPAWSRLVGPAVVVATVTIRLVTGLVAATVILSIVLTALETLTVALLVREFRARNQRFAAAAFAVGFAGLLPSGVPTICLLAGIAAPLGGALTTGGSMAVYGVLQALVLGRDHIRSLREAEARVKDVEQLNEELRRQVAERSRELTEALANSEGNVAPATLGVGDTFDGRYRIMRSLGRGGMGAVYEVERKRDGKKLALKVVTGAMSAKHAARFAREAEIGARLQHENLVSIVDVGIAAGATPFLVMELVQGGSLEDERARFGDAAWAMPIVRQIAAGLAELHANRIVHRDLKPGNVLLAVDDSDSAPVAKISDFGISRFGAFDDGGHVDAEGAPAHAGAAHASPRDLTETGALMGTPVYMPPEAWFGPAKRPSADVFALGVLAYEALTGRSPFPVPPVLLVRSRQPIPAPAPLDGIEAKVASVVLGCLRVEASERPRAKAVAEALGRARA